MPDIHNHIELPHFCFKRQGPSGAIFDVLVVRGAFDFCAGGQRVVRSEEQYNAWGDEYRLAETTCSLGRALIREGDLTLFKPNTDVYLAGCAQTRDEKPQTRWLATLKAGTIQKSLQLRGPRQMKRSALLWRMSLAEAVTSVELDARLSFGGSFAAQVEGKEESVHKADNSAGCGWLPRGELWKVSKAARQEIKAQIAAIKSLPAPQIEGPFWSVGSPYDRAASVGFGPLVPWHKARTRYAGTCDQKWRQTQFPLLPKDFNPRFYQAAPPDQICKGYLQGDEAIELIGLTVEGEISMRLPGMQVVAQVTPGKGDASLRLLPLDTVALDLDNRRMLLTWRVALPQDDAARITVDAINIQKG
jgi:hypothetical protein